MDFNCICKSYKQQKRFREDPETVNEDVNLRKYFLVFEAVSRMLQVLLKSCEALPRIIHGIKFGKRIRINNKK